VAQASAKSGRLTRSAEFERVYRQGRSTANRHLVLYSFPNPSALRPRLGLSVSRKVGGAVERNRVKRLLRESFAAAESQLRPGQDIVVVARPDARELAEREGLTGVDAALGELIDRARLRNDASPPAGRDQAGTATAEPGAGPGPAAAVGTAEGNEGQSDERSSGNEELTDRESANSELTAPGSGTDT
jgi:ribonuclease P protein component